MPMFTCNISVNVLPLSAVIFTDWQSLLQVCTYRHNSHHHHPAAEHRCRSSLRQEIRLWWQVSVSFHNQVEHVLSVVFLHDSDDFKCPDSILNVSYRFLVHRYSVLQQHVEDNTVEGIDDPLETNHTQNGKIEFHDDSDEVQWIPFPLAFLVRLRLCLAAESIACVFISKPCWCLMSRRKRKL